MHSLSSGAYADATRLRIALVVAGSAQVAGIALFFYTMWKRIRRAGSQARELAGSDSDDRG